MIAWRTSHAHSHGGAGSKIERVLKVRARMRMWRARISLWSARMHMDGKQSLTVAQTTPEASENTPRPRPGLGRIQ